MAGKRNSAHPRAEVNSTIVPFKLSGIGIAPNLVNATVNRVPAEVVLPHMGKLVDIYVIWWQTKVGREFHSPLYLLFLYNPCLL